MIDNKDNTVTDETTGLMWHQKTSENTMNWNDAITYCEKLNIEGYTDWRLPTIKELQSLVDYSCCNPAVGETYFQSTVSSFYWSSTTSIFDTNYAWGINFNYGNDINYDKYNYYYVRAVRGYK